MKRLLPNEIAIVLTLLLSLQAFSQVTPPIGSWPIVKENFQNWTRTGYTDTLIGCETDTLIATKQSISYVKKYTNGQNADTIVFTLNDGAVNPICGNKYGNSTDSSDVSNGYIVLQKKITRLDGSISNPSLTLTRLSYVSVVQFSVSFSGGGGNGVQLYTSKNGTDYTLVGTYAPAEAGKGLAYSVAINDSIVSLKFTPSTVSTQYARIHDLKIWSSGVPEGSEVFVDENFQKWHLNGYQLPVPGVVANKTGTQYVLLSTLSSQSFDTTVTYKEGYPIKYTLKDGGVNPDCYNHHGNVTLVYGLTTGYIELPINNALYTNQSINASLTLSKVPSVSLLEFWVSVTGYSGRYQIWKSVNGGEYTLYKDITVPKYAGIGKYFRFYVNEKNVSFKFTTYEGAGGYTTKPKIHGIKVWSDGPVISYSSAIEATDSLIEVGAKTTITAALSPALDTATYTWKTFSEGILLLSASTGSSIDVTGLTVGTDSVLLVVKNGIDSITSSTYKVRVKEVPATGVASIHQSIKVYASADQVTVEAPVNSVVTLTDALGRVVSQSVIAVSPSATSGLKTGLYIVTIQSDGASKTFKVIIR